jgi:hypothetical protein
MWKFSATFVCETRTKIILIYFQELEPEIPLTNILKTSLWKSNSMQNPTFHNSTFFLHQPQICVPCTVVDGILSSVVVPTISCTISMMLAQVM